MSIVESLWRLKSRSLHGCEGLICSDKKLCVQYLYCNFGAGCIFETGGVGCRFQGGANEREVRRGVFRKHIFPQKLVEKVISKEVFKKMSSGVAKICLRKKMFGEMICPRDG